MPLNQAALESAHRAGIFVSPPPHPWAHLHPTVVAALEILSALETAGPEGLTVAELSTKTYRSYESLRLLLPWLLDQRLARSEDFGMGKKYFQPPLTRLSK